MSVQTLYTAASGMEAMETKLDVIANNLANINTTAFKKDRANFEDLLYRAEVYPGALGFPVASGPAEFRDDAGSVVSPMLLRVAVLLLIS